MADGDIFLGFTLNVTDTPQSNLSVSDSVHEHRASLKADRGYVIHLYESNLFDTDIHPVTGISTPGIHTKVVELSDAQDRHFEYELNKPGLWSFRIPLNSAQAMETVGYEIKRCIVVYFFDANRRRIPVWSGPIMNVALSSSGESPSINISCNGWAQLLYGRECRIPYTFTNMDAGVIASRMLAVANNQIANDNVVTGSGITAENLSYNVGQFEDLLNIGIWDSPSTFDSGYPRLNSAWANSGANSIQGQATNRNRGSAVFLNPPGPLSVELSGTIRGVPIDASSIYNIKGYYNVLAVSGTCSTYIAVNWYDVSRIFISQSTTTRISSVSSGSIESRFVSPANAVYMAVSVVFMTGVSGSINACWDDIIYSKNNINQIPLPISIGTVDSPANPAGANRSITYQIGEKIGSTIETLSDLEAGFDWSVDIRDITISGGRTLLRELNIFYSLVKVGSTIYGKGSDKPNVVFSHKWGPDNLSAFSETRDGSRLANRFNTRATGKSAMAQDLQSISELGLWEESGQISDAGVKDNVLLAYSGAEVAYRAYPTRIFSPTPFPWDGNTTSEARIPRFGIDYNIGDIVYIVAKNGALQVGIDSIEGAQPVRLFGLSGDIDNEGNERLSGFQTTVS